MMLTKSQSRSDEGLNSWFQAIKTLRILLCECDGTVTGSQIKARATPLRLESPTYRLCELS